MIKAAIEKILTLAQIQFVEVEDRRYTTGAIHPVEDPQQGAIEVHTLTGLVDFIRDELTTEAKVLVGNYNLVEIASPVHGAFKQRTCYARSAPHPIKQLFGQSLDLEDFIVWLQAGFVQDETTARILAIVGNLTEGAERTHSDDGVTQNVVTRSGISKAEVGLPNPVTLRPYRTFPDIEQPASKFVLRIKAGQGGGKPTVRLMEADGGAWKVTAVKTIKEWFNENLPEHTVIA